MVYHHAKLMLVSLVLGIVGCWPEDGGGVSPPVKSAYLYYPIGVGLSEPENRFLVVANSNFDLAYSSGTVVPLDLTRLDEVLGACRGQPGSEEGDRSWCPRLIAGPLDGQAEDVWRPSDDGLDFVLDKHAVGIRSYAGALAVFDGLVFVPVRADNSLHFMDIHSDEGFDPDSRRLLRCTWGPGSWQPTGLQDCHRYRRVGDNRLYLSDLVLDVPAEPFVVTPWQGAAHKQVDDQGDEDSDPVNRSYVIVGHMVGSDISLFEVRPEQPINEHFTAGDRLAACEEQRADPNDCLGRMVQLIDVDSAFASGTTGIAVDSSGQFWASSRFESQISRFFVYEPLEEGDGDDPVWAGGRAEIGPLGAAENSAVEPGNNQRGVAVYHAPPGAADRVYVVNREPASVVAFKVDSSVSGGLELVGVIPIGAEPSLIEVVADDEAPGGHGVYVACFDDARVYAIDPVARDIEDVIDAGQGPHDLHYDSTRQVLYVVNFLESTVSVVDVNRAQPDTLHSVLTTLGTPRRPRSND
jgi:hypothetical protein